MNDDVCRARQLLYETAVEYREVLKENLVGVYEHGSLAFGCFRWEVSDVDFLVVVRKPLQQAEKEGLIRILMGKADRAPEKGFEMSVVLAEDVNPFRYPTPFQLHYSEFHREGAVRDLAEYCRRMNGADRDLAAHCTVTRARGRTVLGKEISEVFGEVPWDDYLDSIRYDIGNAEEDILENPVYMTLNLCRVLAAVRDRLVLSKEEGGRWALEEVNQKWHGLISGALGAYGRGGAFAPEAAGLAVFAGDMLTEIEDFA